MDFSDNTLYVLAIILFFGLIIPEFFKPLQFPFATSLIIVGSVLGPYGLDYVQPDETMETFGFLGAAFMMLISGFEARTVRFGWNSYRLTAINGLIPFLTGILIVRAFGYNWEASIATGIIFMSSSIAIVFSNIKNYDLSKRGIGRAIESVIILEDITSVLFLSMLVQYVEKDMRFPLFIYFGLLVSSVIILRMFLPEILIYFLRRFAGNRNLYEAQLRIVIALLLFVLLFYSALDVHPVIAAFLVGFSIAKVRRTAPVRQKLETIAYGIFVPIFFFIIGVQMDLTIFLKLDIKNMLVISVVAGALISKFLSGYIGGKIEHFPEKEAVFFGLVSSSRLTIAVTTTYAALLLDIIDRDLLTALIAVSVVSAVLIPIVVNMLNSPPKQISAND